MTADWVKDRICNLYKSWAMTIEKRLRKLGMNNIRELRGRWDLLSFSSDEEKFMQKTSAINHKA
jgi:glutamate synthase domain-containing protein 2